MNNRIISLQVAIDTIKNMRERCDTNDINDYFDLLIEAFNVLPSVQPDHSDEVKFWKERAESYEKTCFNLLDNINRNVKINSIEINENGIIFTKKQKRSCDGCKHLGIWENEIEYGCSCPCLRCVRRADDNYER